jgi:hypothetical protein
MPIQTPAIGDGSQSPEESEQRTPIDDPLDPIVQDNIDAIVRIGPPPLDERNNTSSNPNQYWIVELEIHLTDGSASNYAMGKIVPRGHNRIPEVRPLNDDRMSDIIHIEVDNQLTEAREDTEEITRVFTGVVSNVSRIEHNLFEFMAFWPGFNEIQNGTLSQSLPAPRTGVEFKYSNEEVNVTDYGQRQHSARDLAQEIGDIITAPPNEFPYNIYLSEDGFDVNGVNYGANQRVLIRNFDVPLVAESTDEGILQRIVNVTNSVWDVDRYGNFHIGPPIPDNEKFSDIDVPTKVKSHKLRYITETSAGKQSPAWRSVRVIGDGVVSQDGWASSALINENIAKYSSPVTEAGETTPDTDDLAKPVFEYVNEEINTASEAEHVLEKLKEEIRKQAAGGEVTVVGHPEVWPGDAIEMPDTENQPFGLERYRVSKVIHRINNSDGFLTKIEVSGQTNATDAIFSDEVEGPDASELDYQHPGGADRFRNE